jgi:hypothetical protein
VSNVHNVNQFFAGPEGIYKKLFKFSLSPYTGWTLAETGRGVGSNPVAAGGLVAVALLNIGVKVVLSPILLPLTAITASLALVGAALSALAHLLSLGAASVADCCSNPNPAL